jgi:prolyl oligopeptidase
VAALMASTAGEAPHLLRIDLKAGHKDGKPTHLLIQEHADVLAFAAYALDMNVAF